MNTLGKFVKTFKERVINNEQLINEKKKIIYQNSKCCSELSNRNIQTNYYASTAAGG